MEYTTEIFEQKIFSADSKIIGEYSIMEFYPTDETADEDHDKEPTEVKPDFVYLASICIDDSYRGRGLGGKLLRELAEKYEKIYLTSENPRCRHLYARLGTEVPYHKIPVELQANADNACLENDDGEIDEDFSGMYLIER